tara:strand:- start:462 stop:725 length:264 start_codon:yes stop_codon:yes gene_type:complete
MSVVLVEKQEFLEVIANRKAPGDRWILEGDTVIHNSLTETLEAWFQSSGESAEFKLAPLTGKLYVIREEEIEVKPKEPKKFNIYGDY